LQRQNPSERSSRKDGSPRGTTLLRRPHRSPHFNAITGGPGPVPMEGFPPSTGHLTGDFSVGSCRPGSQSATPLSVGPGDAYSSRSAAKPMLLMSIMAPSPPACQRASDRAWLVDGAGEVRARSRTQKTAVLASHRGAGASYGIDQLAGTLGQDGPVATRHAVGVDKVATKCDGDGSRFDEGPSVLGGDATGRHHL